MNDKPFIKLFKTRGGFYFFEANKNSIVKVSKKEYDVLNSFMNNENICNADYLIIKNFKNKGYLSFNRIEEVENPINEIVHFIIEGSLTGITLQVTQQCNFRCNYCVYSGIYNNRTHSNKRMSFETAKKSIDFAIAHSKNIEKLGIGFYGGEPLLEFNLIKKCIEYVDHEYPGKKVVYNLTSNGYLLTDEIIKYFAEHDVKLVISLDGPKEVHDSGRKLAINNSSTFDVVMKNIRNIRENYSTYLSNVIVNAVIGSKNDYNAIADFFDNNDDVKDISVNITAISTYHIKDKERFIDLNKFQNDIEYGYFREYYYLLKKKKGKSSKMTKSFKDSIISFSENFKPRKSLPKKAHPGGPCTPGGRRLFVTYDGELFPCEKCSETCSASNIGNLEKGYDIEKIKNLLNVGKLTEEECKDCVAMEHCKVCVGTMEVDRDEFCAESKKEICEASKNSFEEMLKNYCVLKEFGYEFLD